MRKFSTNINSTTDFYILCKRVSRLFVQKFLSHSADKIRRRTLLCFERILVSKIFMHRRGGLRFCRNFLSHRTETKSFVKEPFCFREIFWYRKNLWIRGDISRFSVEIFMSHSAKNFVRELYCFWENFWFRKVLWMKRGGITFFRRKILVSQCQKVSLGNTSVFQKIWGIEKFYA